MVGPGSSRELPTGRKLHIKSPGLPPILPPMGHVRARMVMLSRCGPVHLAIRADFAADIAPIDVLAAVMLSIPINHRGPVVDAVVEVDGTTCRVPAMTWTHALLDQVCPGATLARYPHGY